METLKNANTILFCDESKFYINAGDVEDATFYFAVAVKKEQTANIHKLFLKTIAKHRVKADVFHATTLFRDSKPREKLMQDLVEIITKNQLHCFVFKYSKEALYKPTKHLNYLNDGDIIKFENAEFQALFYFLMILNTHLRDKMANEIKLDVVMYFDRNVYGKTDTEVFNFPHDEFVIKHMTFCKKDLISLIALPDFVGYIFRRSKISKNRVEAGDLALETSLLTINSFLSLTAINEASLFHFLDIDEYKNDIDKLFITKSDN